MAALDLAGARVFAERGRTNSARWYLLPDNRVFHSRTSGHLEPSIHTAADVAGSLALAEVLAT
jgi:hypothetical protein